MIFFFLFFFLFELIYSDSNEEGSLSVMSYFVLFCWCYEYLCGQANLSLRIINKILPCIHEIVCVTMQWQIIDTTWDHLIRCGRTPPPPIIQERFCIKLQENDHLSAISCVDAHRGSETHAFSEKAWLYLLQNNSHRFKNDTIFRLMRKLNHITDESDGPCHMYQNLLNACRKLTEASNNASTRK